MAANQNYNSHSWKKLDKTIRVDLITIIENVRHGAEIELWKIKKDYFDEQKKHLEYCLYLFGLKYRSYEFSYYVSKNKKRIEQL